MQTLFVDDPQFPHHRFAKSVRACRQQAGSDVDVLPAGFLRRFRSGKKRRPASHLVQPDQHGQVYPGEDFHIRGLHDRNGEV